MPERSAAGWGELRIERMPTRLASLTLPCREGDKRVASLHKSKRPGLATGPFVT